MRTPLRSTAPESRPPDSWVPWPFSGSASAGAWCMAYAGTWTGPWACAGLSPGSWVMCCGAGRGWYPPCSGSGACAAPSGYWPGTGAACGSLQAPWGLGISRRSSSSDACSEGSRKV
ncbi:hypothetical protein [Streptomyces sp. RKAG290]|uniref:hypothetical protein n=1 Tax=Streptomyces sp. RKAG290 TaxID=2888348 RepID=UPI0035A8E400